MKAVCSGNYVTKNFAYTKHYYFVIGDSVAFPPHREIDQSVAEILRTDEEFAIVLDLSEKYWICLNGDEQNLFTYRGP